MKYEIMLKILFLMLQKKKVTAKQLSERYEINQRTVYRYIEALELAGVPIIRERGSNGGFTLPDTYKIPATFFTKEEFTEILNVLSSYNTEIPSKNVSSALDKIKAVNKNADFDLNVTDGNLIIDSSSWGDRGTYQTLLPVINEALNKNKVLKMKYHDREGVCSERFIEPHRLILKQGLWYVYAYCRTRNDFRLFKTGRIEYANITAETFVKRPIGKETFNFNDWLKSADCVDVCLLVEKEYRSDVEEWLGIGNVTEDSNGVIKAYAKLPNDKGLVSKILSFGTGVTVTEPESLKKRILTDLNNLQKKYSE